MENMKEKYAIAVEAYPPISPNKKTIMKGMIIAFDSTGNTPPASNFSHVFLINRPTMYEPNAPSRVASEPIKTS